MHGNPGVRKGAWTEEEDILLRKCIEKYGEGKWHQVPARAGLNRCRKSCRLRWLNYLRPDIKRGDFALDEVDLIIRLHKLLGNRWSLIAGRLPGRTANDVKNYWNTHLQKKMTTSRELEEVKTRERSNTKTLARASNIVKPRPWTFRKNASFFREKTTNAETAAQTNDGTIKYSSPTSQLTEKDNMPWWDNMFLGEECREGTTWSLEVGGSGEDNITTLWSDELSQLGVEEGGNWTHKNQDGRDYFSIYADLWDLISDQQAMQ